MAAGWRDISRLSYFLRATPTRRRKKWEAGGKAASGHRCRLVIAVLEINFRDSDSASAAGTGLPAVVESEMKRLFRAFPDAAFAPPFNLASERRNDRRVHYRRSNQSPVSSRHFLPAPPTEDACPPGLFAAALPDFLSNFCRASLR